MNGLLRFCLVAWMALPGLALPAAPRQPVALEVGNAVSQSPDGTVVIDSLSDPAEFGWRRYTLNANTAQFQPNRRYRVRFACRVAGGGRDARLLVLVRPLSRNDDRKDVLSQVVRPTDGEWRTFAIPFETEDATDYRLMFNSWNRIRAEIRDVTVEARPSLAFVPASAKGPVAATARPNLPRGARAFDVDLPRPASTLVLDAADYGVSVASADNTAALRTAFAEAKARGAAKLTLAPGVYRLTGDAPLTLEGFRDFTFDARGVTFLTHRREGAFMHLARCVRVRLVGFTLDWDWEREPLASLVRVVRSGKDFFDFEFADYADFPCRDAMRELLHFIPREVEARAPGFVEGACGRECSASVKRTWLDGRTVRVFDRPWAMAPGQLYRLQHYYYHMGGFAMDSNEHLRFEDITVKSTPGHAFHMRGTQHHTLFSRVNIVAPKDDPRRVITCTADHFHVASSRGFIKMEDCEFALGEDDFVNVHDNTTFARRRSQKVLRATGYGHLPKGARVEVRNGDYSPTGFTGTVAEVKRAPAGERGFDIAFEEDVPPETKDGFVLFDTARDTRNVIIRNCLFRDNRSRGILVLARDVTIENNVFRHTASGAINLATGYTFNLWSEGYGVSNVVIRGNLFDNANPTGAGARHRRPTIYAGIYLKTDPSDATTDYPILRDILIERNVFRDSFGVAAYLSSVHDVTVRDNLLEDRVPRHQNLPFRAQFHLLQATNVQILNNVYRPSPFVAAPGVTYDPENCTGLKIEGNRTVAGEVQVADPLAREFL